MIQRLEDWLGIHADGTVEAPKAFDHQMDADEQLDQQYAVFDPFTDLCKRRFLWYYDSYVAAITEAEKKVKEGEPFKKMPFEGDGNSMDGKFNYVELRRRLDLIRETLDSETERWAQEGVALQRKESGIAANLQRQFEQIIESYKRNDSVTLDIDFVDGNPFVWQITYFGWPMTQLDGGMFKIIMCVSPRFPDEQPRVTFETPLFHHRVSKDGVFCYFPGNGGDIKSHIQAMIEALEDESPPYDPRAMVNPEAAKLFWGSADDKKTYNRRLRRAVQRSTE